MTELRQKTAAARLAAAKLKDAGHHFEANQVFALCRAAESLLVTARRQFAELQELRQRRHP